MAIRGWSASIATAIGVAAAAGAAQLGVAYGTGVITWRPEPDGLAESAWSAGVIWAAWIAATSVVAGAVVAERLRTGNPGADDPLADGGGNDDRFTRLLGRLVLSIAAGIGAMITAALVAVPARDAAVTGVDATQALALGYVGLGLLAGVVISVGALAARAVAANLIATAGWLWALAVTAVMVAVVTGQEWSVVSLGYWDPDVGQVWWGNLLLPETGIALAAALVIGALAALPAARRGDHPAGVVISGAAGPVVVAIAYVVAQPDLAGVAAAELSRHLAAPYLVLAGLLGSLLVSGVRPRTARESERDQVHDDDDGSLDAAVAVPAARQPA
jgi:hypothetical protein